MKIDKEFQALIPQLLPEEKKILQRGSWQIRKRRECFFGEIIRQAVHRKDFVSLPRRKTADQNIRYS